MSEKTKVRALNGMLITLIVVLGLVITYLMGYGDAFFSYFGYTKDIILINKENIEKYVYSDRMKISIPNGKLFGGMWKDFEDKRTDAIIIISENEYIKIFNMIDKEVRQYKFDEYMAHINKMGKHLLLLNILKYDILSFLKETFNNDEHGDISEDAPVVYGCLILPNTNGGLKVMSKSKIMDISCNWKDIINYIYPKQRT